MSPTPNAHAILTPQRIVAGEIVIIILASIYPLALATGAGAPSMSYQIWGICWCLSLTIAIGTWWYHRRRQTLTSRRQRLIIGLHLAVSSLVPLFISSVLRISHRIPCINPADPCAGQMEVDVVETGGWRLLHHGTPYLDIAALTRAADPADYNPYSPAMSLTGIPAAFWGNHWYTDMRWFCLLGTVAALWAAWRLAGSPRIPTAALALVAITPNVSLTVAASGTDALVIAWGILALTAAWRGRIVLAGAVLAVALGLKLTAIPIAVIAVIFIGARHPQGLRAALQTSALAVMGTVLIHLPAFVFNARSFVENVIRYPMGLAEMPSVAAAPLPGYLIANYLPHGSTLSVLLLGVCAVAIVGTLLARPPRGLAHAALAVAASLSIAMLMLPSSRLGYLVYPMSFFALALAAEWRPQRLLAWLTQLTGPASALIPAAGDAPRTYAAELPTYPRSS